MTPMISPKRTRTDRKPITAREPSKMAAELRKPYCGRFLAMTIR